MFFWHFHLQLHHSKGFPSVENPWYDQFFLDLTPSDHTDMPDWLNSFGKSLRSCYETTADIQNLDDAIGLQRRAVDLTPSDHPALPSLLNNLGASLQLQYQLTTNSQDLENAMSTFQRA